MGNINEDHDNVPDTGSNPESSVESESDSTTNSSLTPPAPRTGNLQVTYVK